MHNGVRVIRKDGNEEEIYYVYISAEHEFPDPDVWKYQTFYTTDCIVDRIEDQNGKEVDHVYGIGIIGGVGVDYRKGERVTGRRTYYARNKEVLQIFLDQKEGKTIVINPSHCVRSLIEMLVTPVGQKGNAGRNKCD